MKFPKNAFLASCLLLAFARCHVAAADYRMKKPVELTFATISVGTGMYTNAAAIAQLFDKAFPSGSIVDVSTTSPGGVGASVVVNNGECDLSLGNAVFTKWAVETGILGQPPVTKVASVAGGIDNIVINVLFTQDFVNRTGLTTVEDIVAKRHPVRLTTKTVGSGGELAASAVFEALGATYADIKSWGGTVTHTGADAASSLLKDGKADITIDLLNPGQATTAELCLTTKMFFPALAPATLDKLVERGFDRVAIPAGAWSGQSADIASVGSPQVVIVNTDTVDDATAYTMAKAICEGVDHLKSVSASMANFDAQAAWQPLKCGAPLHPGAEAYYRQAGYMK